MVGRGELTHFVGDVVYGNILMKVPNGAFV